MENKDINETDNITFSHRQINKKESIHQANKENDKLKDKLKNEKTQEDLNKQKIINSKSLNHQTPNKTYFFKSSLSFKNRETNLKEIEEDMKIGDNIVKKNMPNSKFAKPNLNILAKKDELNNIYTNKNNQNHSEENTNEADFQDNYHYENQFA